MTGGMSIFAGGVFSDEDLSLKHDRPGLVGFVSCGPDTNCSQFYITLNAVPGLDGRSQIIGELEDDIIIPVLRNAGTIMGYPLEDLYILDSGIVTE